MSYIVECLLFPNTWRHPKIRDLASQTFLLSPPPTILKGRYTLILFQVYSVQVWYCHQLLYSLLSNFQCTPPDLSRTLVYSKLHAHIYVYVKAMPKLYRVFYRWVVSGRCYSLQQLKVKREE